MDVGFATDPETIWRKILEVKQISPELPEKTWQVIEEFFRISPEALEKMPSLFREIELRGAIHSQQQTLIRQLRHKFSDVPDKVVRRIESTKNSRQLDQWLEQILDADSLEEMGLLPKAKSPNPNKRK